MPRASWRETPPWINDLALHDGLMVYPDSDVADLAADRDVEEGVKSRRSLRLLKNRLLTCLPVLIVEALENCSVVEGSKSLLLLFPS